MSKRLIASSAMVLLLCIPVLSIAADRSDVADAVMKGDTAAVQKLLRQKADVNAQQVDGASALHWAVYRDDLEMADLLIRAGAKASVANRVGITPLHMASLYGNVTMIEKLLKAGADAKQKGPNGETMLMLAARSGSAGAVRMLIAAGADVNAKEPQRGTTALMWAVEQKHPAAVKALLDGKADFAATSGGAGLPRNYFANKIDIRVVEAAQRRYAVAAAAGRTYEEQLAIDLGASASSVGRRGLGATPAADQSGQTGAQPVGQAAPAPAPAAANANAANDAADQDVIVAGLVGTGGGGLTALILAAREGDLESAKVLLEAGADVNQSTNYGWTPLLTATNNRHYQLGKFLMDQGADANIANKGAWTPLYLATDNANIEGGDFPVRKPDMDSLEYIKMLLDQRANPNARIKDNTLTRTIFTMQWLFESGATAFLRASQSSDVALMKLLLAYGADPKISTDFGDTALTAASGIGWVEGVTYEHSVKENLEAVKMLLDLGLDPNAANQEGRTPLMGAALKGRNDVVKLLVDRGAKLETRDRGSRDTDRIGGKNVGHTWQALDYADGLVRVGVQSAISWPETAALIRKLMTERGMPVPPANRVVESVCIVELCKERLGESLK